MIRTYVYCTLSNDQLYTTYAPAVDKGALPIVVKQVLIKGGANVADPKRGTVMHGKMTLVSEEDYEHLKHNEVFKMHLKNGFLHVRQEKLDPEIIAKQHMTDRDESAPYNAKSREFNDESVGKPMEEKPSIVDRVKGMMGVADDETSV